MALNIQWSWKKGGETIKSGEFCTFSYSAWQNDPEPVCIFINKITGIHENTGHQWRLIQGISLNYIPRRDRKRFVKDWYNYMSKNKSAKFTWQLVKRRYPYIQHAIRRFQIKPDYYISNFRKLEGEEIGQEVVRNWGKDFSKFLKRKILQKIKR
jgi:hypothetical protein